MFNPNGLNDYIQVNLLFVSNCEPRSASLQLLGQDDTPPTPLPTWKQNITRNFQDF